MLNWEWNSDVSGNGLVLNGRQAIIWTIDGLGYWCIYASHDLD